ncbi:hypothetical protein COLO4_22734 [Corchorus olitorius]|uniref:Uncharacterized protein n=1 Tax=Corchorus olitorius TaxID=93759 RepID=A0A1R3IKC3_9ROSI|nr:hypothetical protein COLO4_22734 [Corchorus olitorius]
MGNTKILGWIRVWAEPSGNKSGDHVVVHVWTNELKDA